MIRLAKYEDLPEIMLIYDGTLEQWAQIETEYHKPGGFNTRCCAEIRCTNGSITYDDGMIVQYDGTLEQFKAAFDWMDLEDYDYDDVKQVICTDGVIDVAGGETW